MKQLLVVALLCVPWAGTALAQQAVRVPTCGQVGVAPPNVSPLFVDANGNLCTNMAGGGTAPGTPGATAQSVQGVPGGVAVPTKPGALTIVPLDVATVTTGGSAVTALTAGHRTAGGWLFNPTTATINLCINEQGTASGTTSSNATTCIAPGQTYMLTATAGAVSVISSNSAHAFSGMGWQ